MASFNVRELTESMAGLISELRNLKGDVKDVKTAFDDLNKSFAQSEKETAKLAEISEKHQSKLQKNAQIQRETTATINANTKLQSQQAKTIESLTEKISKLQEQLKNLKQQNKEAGASFKATAKDMATMLNEAFYGNGTKKQPNLANFFKKEFASLATSITSELKNIQVNTVSIGMDIGDSLKRGLSDGVKKGKGGKGGTGIAEVMDAILATELKNIQARVQKQVAKIASDIGLKTTDGIKKAMEAVNEGRRDNKALQGYKTFQLWGTPEKKAEYQKNFNQEIQQLENHQKNILKMTEKHGYELTDKQKENLKRIQSITEKARGFASRGMEKLQGANTFLGNVKALEEEARALKENHAKSLNMSKTWAEATKQQQKAKLEGELHIDKVDEMLMQSKLQRQNKLSKSIISIVKEQESQITKLSTGISRKSQGSGNKPSSMIVKTDDEAKVMNSIKFITERMKELQKNEKVTVEERTQLMKSYSDQFVQQHTRLVAMINDRLKVEKDYQNWWKTEGVAGLDARLKKEKEVDTMWQKLLGDKEKETIKAEKKAQADRLKAQTEFAEQQLKQEQSLQERLRRLTGKFTEQEKYTKSKKYLDLSMNNQVKAEVDQANRIQNLIQGYQRAKTKAGAATTDGDRIKWEDQTKALMAAAERETNVLKEMVYKRLNADRESLASKKKLEKEETRRLNEFAAGERKMLAQSATEQRNKARQQKKLDKEATENFKIWQKAGEEAARRVSKAWTELGAAIGLGWRNRNLMESFQQFAHGIRRFGHDAGMMVEQVASRIMYLTATFTALGAGIAGALAYGAKQIYNFGQNIIKTTEEVRGYQIALYGMMGTQAGVNEMLEVAEKVTKDMPIGFKTIQESVKGMVLIGPVRDMLRNTKDIEGVMGSLFKIVVGLSQIQPEWGAKGAIFSLRNALTGDLRSLQRRFELPVRAIYSAEGVPLQDLQYQPEKMVETLDTYISSFYSSETLKMSSNQFSAIIEKMAGNWIKFIKSIGDSGFYDLITADLGKIRDAIQEFVDSDDFGKITKQISDSMGNMYEAIRNIATYLGGYIGNMFGITGIQDITDIGGAFEYLAKVMRVIEKLITSGTLINLVKSIGTDLKNKLVTPIIYVKDLIGEMVQDAIGFGKVVGGVFESIFAKTKGGSGGLIGNKTLEKGLLWTLFFGPGNVSMLFGSIALLINSTLGVFANMFNVMLKTINLIRVSWIGAWLAPFAPVIKAIAGISALIAGIFANIVFKDEIQGIFDWVAKSAERFLETLVSGIPWVINKVVDALAERIPALSLMIKKQPSSYIEYKEQKSELEYVLKNNPSLEELYTERNKLQNVSDTRYYQDQNAPAGAYAEGSIRMSGQRVDLEKLSQINRQIETVIDTQKQLKELEAIDLKTLNLTPVSPFADLKNKIKDYFNSMIGNINGTSDTLVTSKEQLETEIKRHIAKMDNPVVIEGLKESTMAGGLTLLQSMEQLGFNAKITSAFRAGDTGSTHSDGLSLDIQDLSKSMMDETLFKMFAEMKSKGYIEKVIAEQSPGAKTFDFTSPLFKEYDIDTMSYTGKGKDRKPVKSQGHFHVEFSERAKELANIVTAQNMVVGMTSKSMEESMMRAIAEVESASLASYSPTLFTDEFERGTALLKNVSNLEESMGSVTRGLTQHVSKMASMVESAFNDLKDDEGHMFGPDAIDKLRASWEAASTEREKIFGRIRKTLGDDATKETINARAYEEIVGRQMKMASAGIYKKASSDITTDVVTQFPVIGMGADPTVAMSAAMAQSTEKLKESQEAIAKTYKEATGYAEKIVYKYEEFQQEFEKTLGIAKEFSANYLKDQMLSKTYELTILTPETMKDTWDRQFDIKALEEALSLTYAIHSNFASTEKDATQLVNSVIRMTREGMTFEEASKKALAAYVSENKLNVEQADALLNTLTEQRKIIYDNTKYLNDQRKIYGQLVTNLKIMNLEQLKAAKGQYLGSKSPAVRKGWASEYRSRIEEGIETDSLDNIFANGMDAAIAEWDSFEMVVLNGATTMANDMRQTFEDGFFDVMTGKLEGLREVFRNVGKSIINTIARIISQMAAISMTKMILGVDIQGSMSGSSSAAGGLGGLLGGSGGIGGMIGNLLYGDSSPLSNTQQIGVDAARAGSMGAAGQVMNLVGMGGSADLVSKALTAVSATGGITKSASGGLLGKLGIGKITPLSALGLTAAASFLTSPGRIFGGTKDKTGDAQQALSDYNTQRQGYLNRRNDDALSYYMGGTSGLTNYQFGGIGYNTWTSGDGWFKGPKEKHAAADPSSYLASLKNYYNLLMNAGKEHYGNMKGIHQLAETNELASIKRQYEFDKTKLRMTQLAYDTYASDSYTESDKYEKMDEYRDKVLDQEFANWEMREQIAKLEKETYYKQMEYDVFKLTSGTDSIAMAKVALEIEKDRHKQYTQGTIEWYDSKMALMNSESELAQTLRNVAKQTQENLNNVMKQIYEIGDAGNSSISRSTTGAMMGIYGKYAEKKAFQSHEYTQAQLASRATLVYKPTGEYSPKKLVYSGTSSSGLTDYDPILAKYQKDNPNNRYTVETQRSLANNVQASTLRFGVPAWRDTFNIYEETALMEKQWNLSIDEIVENIDEEIQDYLENYALDIKKMELRRDIGRSIYQLDTAVDYQYERLLERKTDLDQIDYLNTSLIKQGNMPLMDSAELNITKKEFEVAVVEFYASLGDQIANVINSGYIDEDSTGIRSFVTAIYGGLNDLAVSVYEDIMMTGRKMGTKSSMLGTIRDMEDFSIYNQVMATDEMAGLKGMMGSNLNMSGYQDPYSAWFDFNKSVIQTRIGNAEEGSEEWFAAQNDLFNLMIENAEKLKEKAENMTRSIEDMLGKIEETMRMRIAEERQTAKGDVYFVDVGSTRNSQQMLDRMLAAVKTNDPEAMKLIEEFKKKMLGIGR